MGADRERAGGGGGGGGVLLCPNLGPTRIISVSNTSYIIIIIHLFLSVFLNSGSSCFIGTLVFIPQGQFK